MCPDGLVVRVSPVNSKVAGSIPGGNFCRQKNLYISDRTFMISQNKKNYVQRKINLIFRKRSGKSKRESWVSLLCIKRR